MAELVVCDFQEVSPLHLNCQIHVCVVHSNSLTTLMSRAPVVMALIPNIDDLHFLSFFIQCLLIL